MDRRNQAPLNGEIVRRRRRRGEADAEGEGVRAAEPEGVHPPAQAEEIAGERSPRRRRATPADPGAPRRPRRRVPHPRAAWRSLEDEAGVQEMAPSARRQLLLRPPPPPRPRRAVAVCHQVRRRRARVVGRAEPGAARVARAAAIAGGVRHRRHGFRLRRARQLPPLPPRRPRPSPRRRRHAPRGVLQRPEQPVAPRAGHAPPPPRLRLLRHRQPPLRRRRRRRADVSRGVRPGEEPVVVRVRHGVADVISVGQLGARREVAREGAGPTSSGGVPRVLAGDRHVDDVDVTGVVTRAARRHGRRVEEPERVRRRTTLRRGLQGRVPPPRLRRGRRRVERLRRRRRAARGGELRRGGGRRHGRAPREALRRAERHERLRRRHRRRRRRWGGDPAAAVGDRRREGADQGVRRESHLRHRRRPRPRQESRPPLPGPRGVAIRDQKFRIAPWKIQER